MFNNEIEGCDDFMKKEYQDVQTFLDDVHNEVNIHELVVEMGIVERKRFKGEFICCLFHNEKTPSMQISEHFWKCYGCGAKGDAVAFLMRYNGMTFMEAVKALADHLAVTMSSTPETLL